MAEKATLRLAMKELVVHTNHMDELLARKNIQTEMIVSSQNQSHMQLKSFLDISLQTNTPVYLQGLDKERALQQLSDKGSDILMSELFDGIERLARKFGEYFKNEGELV